MMAGMRILGIDPGFTGGMVLLVDGVPVSKMVIPVLETVDSKGKTHKEYDADQLVKILEDLRPDLGVCEKEWAMNKGKGQWNQGVSSVFSFAQGYGTLIGVLVALKIPRRLPAPTTWQARIFRGMPRDAFEDTKDMAQEVVRTRWPSVDFRDPSKPKSRKLHSGLCDAACIALFGHLETAS